MASQKAFTFIPQGSIVQHFFIDSQNRVLGFNDPAEYKTNPAYFGANIGRVANRIANAKFSLNGKEYQLYANDGPSSLHGGKIGWDHLAWTLEKSEAVSDKEGGWLDVYSLTSENGDENYPGTVKCVVRYLQYKEKSGDSADGYKEVLEIEYEAQLVGDSDDSTIVNLTNHSYFNLSPPSNTPSIEGTQVSLSSNIYLPVDQYNIPTNDPPAPYPNVSPDEPFTLNATEPKIDNCFIFKSYPSPIPLDTRTLESRLCARAYHPLTKLWLEVLSTEPAFQFYTGDGINVDERPDGSTKKTARAGFCVEPSRYVDAINREAWKGQVVVPKGQVYGSRIVFKGWKGHELPNIPPNKPE